MSKWRKFNCTCCKIYIGNCSSEKGGAVRIVNNDVIGSIEESLAKTLIVSGPPAVQAAKLSSTAIRGVPLMTKVARKYRQLPNQNFDQAEVCILNTHRYI